jgi:hypothetical protein
MVEKETFFATAALTLGPPPGPDRRLMSWGTMVGNKAAPRSATYVDIQNELKFAAKLMTLYFNMRATFLPSGTQLNEISTNLYMGYKQWYETEQKIRAAAEAI